jgi:hypothetical protein
MQAPPSLIQAQANENKARSKVTSITKVICRNNDRLVKLTAEFTRILEETKQATAERDKAQELLIRAEEATQRAKEAQQKSEQAAGRQLREVAARFPGSCEDFDIGGGEDMQVEP